MSFKCEVCKEVQVVGNKEVICNHNGDKNEN